MNVDAAGSLVIDLSVGSTLLLGLGALAAGLTRLPVQRQRAAEVAVVATIAWLVLAIAPLPRRAERLEYDGGSAVETSREGARGVALPVSIEAELPDPKPRAQPALVSDALYRTPPITERPKPSVWPRLLLVLYLAGAAAAAAHVLLGAALVRRLLATSAAPPAWLITFFDARVRAAGVTRARLRITHAGRRPLSAGVFAPAIVLPSSLVDSERHADLCCIIDHELVHLRRGDVASRALFALAGIPLWAHPLFWWLRARANLASEMIADDAAAASIGRNVYARALVGLSADLQPLRSAPGLVPGTFRHRSELTRRIEMLVENHDRLATRWTPVRRGAHLVAAVAAVAVCSVAFGVRPTPVQATTADVRPGAAIDALAGGLADAVSVDARSAEALVVDVAAQRQDARARVAQRQQQLQKQGQQSGQQQGQQRGEQQGLQQGQQQGQQRGQQQGQQQGQQLLQLLHQQAQSAQPRQLPQQQQQSAQQAQSAGQPNPDAFYAETLALAERAVNLNAELAVAGERLAEIERQHQVGVVDAILLRQERAGVMSLQQRLEMVMILVQSEVEATQVEIAEIEKLIQTGRLDSSARAQQVRLHGRLRVLQSVL